MTRRQWELIQEALLGVDLGSHTRAEIDETIKMLDPHGVYDDEGDWVTLEMVGSDNTNYFKIRESSLRRIANSVGAISDEKVFDAKIDEILTECTETQIGGDSDVDYTIVNDDNDVEEAWDDLLDQLDD